MTRSQGQPERPLSPVHGRAGQARGGPRPLRARHGRRDRGRALHPRSQERRQGRRDRRSRPATQGGVEGDDQAAASTSTTGPPTTTGSTEAIEKMIAADKKVGGIQPGKTPATYDRLVDDSVFRDALGDRREEPVASERTLAARPAPDAPRAVRAEPRRRPRALGGRRAHHQPGLPGAAVGDARAAVAA